MERGLCAFRVLGLVNPQKSVFSYGGIEPVFDAVVCAADEELRDDRPLAAVLLMQCNDHLVLL